MAGQPTQLTLAYRGKRKATGGRLPSQTNQMELIMNENYYNPYNDYDQEGYTYTEYNEPPF